MVTFQVCGITEGDRNLTRYIMFNFLKKDLKQM